MKILFSSIWGLYGVGGINTYVYELMDGMSAAGHTVDLFCLSEDGESFAVKGTGRSFNKPDLVRKASEIVERRAPKLHPWIKLHENDKYAFEMAASRLPLHEYDVIHTQDVLSTRAFARVKPVETALVATIHGVFTKEWLVQVKENGGEPEPEFLKYGTIRERLGTVPGGCTIVPSHWVKGMLTSDFSVPENYFTVLPYGVNAEAFQARSHQTTDMTKPAGRKLMMFPARFDAVKGHKYLIDALFKLKQVRHDWECWFPGTGFLKEALEKQVIELGLSDHVRFIGSRKDIPALLRLSDIFVIPSVQDNQPFALIEALLAGKPAVATDAGGIPEMIEHGVTGLICEKRNSDQLFDRLNEVMNDEHLAKRLGEAARLRAQSIWSLPNVVQSTLEVYRRAMRLPPMRPEPYTIPDASIMKHMSR